MLGEEKSVLFSGVTLGIYLTPGQPHGPGATRDIYLTPGQPHGPGAAGQHKLDFMGFAFVL